MDDDPIDSVTDADDEPAASSLWSGLSTRIVSSVVLAALFFGAVWHGGWLFIWLVILSALMMAREWNSLTENEPVVWRIGGLFYVTIPCAALIWLRDVRFADVDDAGKWLVLFVVLIVAVTDIGAYFTGRKVGGPKLAPVISPGKTWAGLGGGVLAAACAGGIAHTFSPYPTVFISSVVWGAVIALLAQGGDLFESWIKRRVGAKDSGTLIPGHGGILDRVDGLVFTVPFYAWCVYLSGQVL